MGLSVAAGQAAGRTAGDALQAGPHMACGRSSSSTTSTTRRQGPHWGGLTLLHTTLLHTTLLHTINLQAGRGTQQVRRLGRRKCAEASISSTTAGLLRCVS